MTTLTGTLVAIGAALLIGVVNPAFWYWAGRKDGYNEGWSDRLFHEERKRLGIEEDEVE